MVFSDQNNLNLFYVYSYLREDGTPYYIGKGKGNRYKKKSKNEVSPPKDTSNIVLCGVNLTEEQAFELEKKLIAEYGRKDIGTGILRNKTNGGDGPAGRVPWNKGKRGLYSTTDATKKILSQMFSGDKNPMYGICGENAPFSGRTHAESTIAIMKEKASGKNNSQYGKRGVLSARYGIPSNPPKGKDNYRYDHTLYCWEEITTGTKIYLTRGDFQLKTGAHRANVYKLLNGECKSCRGYRIIK